MSPRSVLKIFVSSPGDVGEERVLAGRVIERLQGEWAPRAALEGIFWEHEPLRATEDFQSQILSPAETNIVICILWSRLGTRLPPHLTRPDGSRYDSGTQYEFEIAEKGWRLHGRPELLVYRKTVVPIIKEADSKAALERITQRIALERFLESWFENDDGSLRAALTRFESPAQFEDLLEEHLRGLLERLAPASETPGEPVVRPTWTSGSPFRGLEIFERKHAPIFFGRTREISQILDALRAQAAAGRAFVLVLGASGSGKSSVVRAGLLPLLTEPGVIEGAGLWRSAVFVPGLSGDDLFEGLASALVQEEALPELLHDGMTASTIASRLRETPAAADLLVEAALSKVAAEARLALAIDQMEQIFTLSRVTPSVRQDLVAALSALARSGIVWVIGTVRSDFYVRCEEMPGLFELMAGRGQYPLRAPDAAAIGQIIRRPAEAAGLRFEERLATRERLDDLLLQAALLHPESLPLLEFALDQLYQRRAADGLLTFAAYEDMKGLEGAIGTWAEEVFNNQPAAVKAALPSVLRLLVTVRPEADLTPVSQRAPRSDFPSAASRSLVDAFVSARLFVADLAGDGSSTVRLTHEALLTHWSKAKTWLEQDRKFLKARAWIDQDASRWEQEERDKGLLIPAGKILDDADGLLARDKDALRPVLVQYIQDSLAAAERGRFRTRWAAAAVALLVIALLALIPWSLWLRQQRRQSLADSDVTNARNLLRDGRADRALAHLAHALRLDPEDLEAQGLLTDQILSRSWWIPIAESRDESRRDIRFAANSRFFATLSSTGAVRVFETRSLRRVGREIHPPEGSRIQDVAPGGHVLIYTPGEKAVRLWSTRTGQPLSPPIPLMAPFRRSEISPDGRWILLSGAGSSFLWDLVAQKPVELPSPQLFTARFSPDGGKLVLRENSRGEIRSTILDLRTKREVPIPVAPLSFLWSADGQRILALLASGGGQAQFFDAHSGLPLGEKASIRWPRISPDDERLFGVDTDGKLKIWSTRDFSLLATLDVENFRPSFPAWDHDSQRVLAQSIGNVQSGIFQIWDSYTGASVAEMWPDTEQARFLSDGREVVTTARDGTVRVWGAEPVRLQTELYHIPLLVGMDLSEDADRMATLDGLGALRLWDLATGRRLAGKSLFPDGDVGLSTVWLSRDGTTVAVLAENYGIVKIVDFRTGRILDVQVAKDGFDFSPDLRVVANVEGNRLVRRQIGSDRPLSGLIQHDAPIHAFDFTSDGTRIATASEDKTARIWDARTGAPLGDPLRHASPVLAVAVSSNGQRIATGDSDGNAWVWDSRTGKAIAGPMPHPSSVDSIELDREGRHLLTWSDEVVRAWNAANGKLLGVPMESIDNARLSLDGRRVLTEMEGSVRLWESRTGRPLGAARDLPELVAARFSSDDQRVWITTRNGIHVLPAPVFSDEEASHLASLAEAVGGYELDEEGRPTPILDLMSRRRQLRQRFADASESRSNAAFMIRWFLADPKQRTISWLSNRTVDDYMLLHFGQETSEAWDEATAAFPGHPLLLKHPRPQNSSSP